MSEPKASARFFRTEGVLWLVHEDARASETRTLPIPVAQKDWLADFIEQASGYGNPLPSHQKGGGYRIAIRVLGHEAWPRLTIRVRSDGSGPLPRGEWIQEHSKNHLCTLIPQLWHADLIPPLPAQSQ